MFELKTSAGTFNNTLNDIKGKTCSLFNFEKLIREIFQYLLVQVSTPSVTEDQSSRNTEEKLKVETPNQSQNFIDTKTSSWEVTRGSMVELDERPRQDPREFGTMLLYPTKLTPISGKFALIHSLHRKSGRQF